MILEFRTGTRLPTGFGWTTTSWSTWVRTCSTLSSRLLPGSSLPSSTPSTARQTTHCRDSFAPSLSLRQQMKFLMLSGILKRDKDEGIERRNDDRRLTLTEDRRVWQETKEKRVWIFSSCSSSCWKATLTFHTRCSRQGTRTAWGSSPTTSSTSSPSPQQAWKPFPLLPKSAWPSSIQCSKVMHVQLPCKWTLYSSNKADETCPRFSLNHWSVLTDVDIYLKSRVNRKEECVLPSHVEHALPLVLFGKVVEDDDDVDEDDDHLLGKIVEDSGPTFVAQVVQGCSGQMGIYII